MNNRVMTAFGITICCLVGGARALAQGDVPFTGSTAPGDVLRGRGVMDKGSAVSHQNMANARSIDHSSPADSRDERALFAQLCLLLAEPRAALGSGPGSGRNRIAAKPKRPPSRKPARSAVAQALVGTWSRVADARPEPDVRLLPDGRLDDREGLNRWSFDGETLVMTWLDAKVPGKSATIAARVSEDGRSYAGTYKDGTKVSGRKTHDGRDVPDEGEVTYRMIELTLDSDGSGQLKVDSRPGAPAAGADGEGKEEGTKLGDVAGLKGAEVVRLGDGRHRITHDFRSIRDVEDMAGPFNTVDPNQLQARPAAGVLALTPIAQQGRTMAGWDYPRQVRLPLRLRVSLDDFDEDGTIGLILNGPNRTLSTNIYGNMSDREMAGKITAFIFNTDRARRDEAKQLLGFRQPPDALIEKSFRLPPTGALADERLTPRIGHGGQGELKIRRVELTARLVGYVGVGFSPRQGPIVITQINQGAGSRAGLKPGDVVKSVDDVPVATSAQLMARLAKLDPGGSITFGVQREGETLSIRVVAD